MSLIGTAMIEGSRPHINLGVLDGAASAEVSMLLLRAISCCDRDEADAIDFVRKASRLLAAIVLHEGGASSPQNFSGRLAPWQVSKITNYISQRVSCSISTSELADHVKLSTSYFCTLFKSTFGCPPHNYVLAQRIERAKLLMMTTDAALSEIALDCGLSDQAHLSRLFRRFTGITPSAWRRFNMGQNLHAGSDAG